MSACAEYMEQQRANGRYNISYDEVWDAAIKYVEALKPSHNNAMDAIAERYINEVSFLDSNDAGVVRSFVAYLQHQ